MESGHWEEVRRIYGEGLETGLATFESELPEWVHWDQEHLPFARLVAESEANGIWTLQAGIFPENLASVSLHVRAGFREVGRRERIARLRGIWRDVLLLERRSERVGTDEGEAVGGGEGHLLTACD